MDTTKCAQILFATFGHLSPQKGKEADYAQALAELAKIVYRLDGVGFSKPRVPQPSELSSEIWKACVRAANEALDPTGKPLRSTGDYVVAWAADAADPKKPVSSIPIRWPLRETADAVLGPFVDATSQQLISIFVYQKIDGVQALTEDGDASPGVFPRQLLIGMDRSIRLRRQQGKRLISLSTFAAGILLLLFSTFWTWFAADFSKSTLQGFKGTVQIASDRSIDVARICLGATDGKVAWSSAQADCDAAWARTWRAQEPQQAKEFGYDWLRYKFWPGIDVRGSLSLLAPMLLNMCGILLLVFAAGLAVNGLWFGAVLDKRNRISLAGFQLAAWSIVLFGSYSVLSVFNAGVLAQSIRDAAQLGTSPGNVFPSMAWELWLVLGIVLGSPAMSVLINNRKETPGEQRLELSQAPLSVPQDALATRDSPEEASLADLFMGESEGNQRQVDISRLQHLVITLLLLTSYLILLLEYVRAIGGLQTASSAIKIAPVFASMPPVDPTFVALLGVSHAAYLGFKTIPKQ